MKLSYRGVPYETVTSELPTIETGMTAQFRGVAYPLRHAPVGVPLHHPSGMIYRGVSSNRCFKGRFLGGSYYHCAIEFVPIPTEA